MAQTPDGVIRSQDEAALPDISCAMIVIVDHLDADTKLAAMQVSRLLCDLCLQSPKGVRYSMTCDACDGIGQFTTNWRRLRSCRHLHLHLECNEDLLKPDEHITRCSALGLLFTMDEGWQGNLTRITLANMQLDGILPVELARSCPNLRQLSLFKCFIREPRPGQQAKCSSGGASSCPFDHHNSHAHMAAEAIRAACARLTRFDVLDTWMEWGESRDTLLTPLTHMHHLTALTLTMPADLPNQRYHCSICPLVNEARLPVLARECPGLKRLELLGTFRGYKHHVTSSLRYLDACLQHFERLTELDLGRFKHVFTKDDIQPILTAPHLTHVTVSSIRLLEPLALPLDCQWQQLCFTAFTEAPIHVETWANLRLPPTCRLVVRSKDRVWFTSLGNGLERTFQQAVDNVRACGGITWDVPQVAVADNTYPGHVSNLGAMLELMSAVPTSTSGQGSGQQQQRQQQQQRSGPCVKALVLDGFQLDGASVDALGRHLGGQLRSLSLSTCTLDDAAWQGLLPSLPNLQQLSLTFSNSPKTHTLKHLVSMCKSHGLPPPPTGLPGAASTTNHPAGTNCSKPTDSGVGWPTPDATTTATTSTTNHPAVTPVALAAAAVARCLAEGQVKNGASAPGVTQSAQSENQGASDAIMQPLHVKVVFGAGSSDISWWQAHIDKQLPAGSRVRVEVVRLGQGGQRSAGRSGGSAVGSSCCVM